MIISRSLYYGDQLTLGLFHLRSWGGGRNGNFTDPLSHIFIQKCITTLFPNKSKKGFSNALCSLRCSASARSTSLILVLSGIIWICWQFCFQSQQCVTLDKAWPISYHKSRVQYFHVEIGESDKVRWGGYLHLTLLRVPGVNSDPRGAKRVIIFQ